MVGLGRLGVGGVGFGGQRGEAKDLKLVGEEGVFFCVGVGRHQHVCIKTLAM